MTNQNPRYSLLFITILGLFVSCKSEQTNKNAIELKTLAASDINDKDYQIDTLMVDISSEENTTHSKVENEATNLSSKDTTILDKKEVMDVKPKVKYLPKIEFEELVWDFGEISEGEIIEKKFKFTNVGNAPLEIIATKATCGCTLPSFPFLEIAPGESNVIGVTYNSVGKIGVQNPEITVEANTEPKITIIKLKGYVVSKEKNDAPILVNDTSIIKNQ